MGVKAPEMIDGCAVRVVEVHHDQCAAHLLQIKV